MSDRPGPLVGLKVLDFTWAAAGPIATSYMAFLGADVAKVESTSRPDLMRVAGRQYGYLDDDDLNGQPAFQEVAAGKRSIELDLSTESGVQVALKLAAQADVLIENMRPGKIEQLGLGYDVVSKLNPQIVMVSQSATGRIEGPAVPGYAPIFWSEGGGSYVTGWPEARPGVVRGPVDLHAAAYALLGVLALLARRDQTGIGGYVDCSAIETVSATLGVELLEVSLGLPIPERSGNKWPGWNIFNDVLPCAGSDQWVAVSARNSEETASLASIVGLSDEHVLTSFIEGSDDGSEFYKALAERTQHMDPRRLEARLTAAGIPAAQSISLGMAKDEARLMDRGAWQFLDHETIGRQRIIGLPWTFNGEPYEVPTGAPRLGEHSDAIVHEWLGARD
jgi:benzylsuccinate CoA-transferase BbsF subunit